jgi:predicted AAA+ superfamily ATPase
MGEAFLFNGMRLSSALVADIVRLNPWWEGKPLPVLPVTRRHLVETMDLRLQRNLAPIVVVRGPRQIGKTTAQLQLIQMLLDRGVAPSRIFRLQCDELPEITRLSEPILRVVDWYEQAVLKHTLNETAHQGQTAFVFLDEVQNLKEWPPQLKGLVDSSTVHMVVTGSSALRIEQGRDSLAGRISTIESGVLTLTEIGAFCGAETGSPRWVDNGLDAFAKREFWMELRESGAKAKQARDEAFARFSERGGYPLAHKNYDIPWEHVADQLNETVIKRVIQHDLRVGDRGRPEGCRRP